MVRAPRNKKATCPYCGREMRIPGGMFNAHNVTMFGNEECPMSRQPVPTRSGDDHEARVRIALHLAALLRDEDPTLVQTYLTCMDDAELQRFSMLLLAGINPGVGRSLWSWVETLPCARFEDVAS